MPETVDLLASPLQPDEVRMDPRMQQLGADLSQLLLRLWTEPPTAQAGLCMHLRERLEQGRASLLGQGSSLPHSLRHCAVSLTEVQWYLDAWIAASEAGGGDAAQLQRDFFQAASRLLDAAQRPQVSRVVTETAATVPAQRRPLAWWARGWTALWSRGPAGRDGTEEGGFGIGA